MPNQFQPKPFQSFPLVCHSRALDPPTPVAGATLTLLAQAPLRLQFDHTLAPPPCLAPSQTTSGAVVLRSAFPAVAPATSFEGRRMQAEAATSAATINRIPFDVAAHVPASFGSLKHVVSITFNSSLPTCAAMRNEALAGGRVAHAIHIAHDVSSHCPP